MLIEDWSISEVKVFEINILKLPSIGLFICHKKVQTFRVLMLPGGWPLYGPWRLSVSAVRAYL
jgi:hypothetical protein